MNSWIFQTMLVGYQSRLESLAHGIRSKQSGLDSGDIVIVLLIMAGFTAGIWGLSLLAAKQGRRGRSNNPRKLFVSLCRAHGLNWSARRLLAKVARWQRLAQPGRLFVEPERFDVTNLSASLKRQQPRLVEIREMLFAAPESDD